jgi:hypothetical protein
LGADLQELLGVGIERTAADALGAVEVHVRLGGVRIAEDADPDAVGDQITRLKIAER